MLFENKLFPSYSRIQIAIDKKQGLSLFRIPNFDQGARIGRETVIFVQSQRTEFTLHQSPAAPALLRSKLPLETSGDSIQNNSN